MTADLFHKDSSGRWPTPLSITGDPVEANGPFVFTCEHASNAVGSLRTTPADEGLLNSHWGWDIGAAALVEELANGTNSVGVLAGYSRLIIDNNRRTDSNTLILQYCGEQPVQMNENLQDEHRSERIEQVYTPYHEAVDQLIEQRLQRSPVHLVSIHSFTPHWPGEDRPMQVGVLFDRYEDEAQTLCEGIRSQGFRAALNAPYSGRAGELMYGASHHGSRHGIPYLELEIRQDQLATAESITNVATRLILALETFQP